MTAAVGGLEPITIMSDDGTIWLGSHDAVLAIIHAEEGPDYTIAPSGWMCNVGWDREMYTLKREFLAESGFTSWWEGCSPPKDGVETKKCRPAWEVIRTPTV